ncbi:uncharacterized protein LOC124114962 [Haliotis rufescens]|uniref:uncharacterized protein LOC124114962 n=1 Tax=Haliotis rufescens TaxID=6454 RepID=UPI00201FA3AE|nr:uncharacterized protein LOC124114962 [Haliotis rufescens]
MEVVPTLYLVYIVLSSNVGVFGIISRCTLKKEDSLSFQCRKHHVIYDPIISLGRSDEHPCMAGPDDCTGLNRELLRKRRKCFWRRRCSLQWKTGQPIKSSDQDRCIDKIPTYVAYDTPKCILKAKVFSMCDNSVKLSQAKEGIIRSHDLFPGQFPRLGNTTCTQILKLKAGHRLHLSVDHLRLDAVDRLTVRHFRGAKKLELINSNSLKSKQFDVVEGYLNITLKVSSKGLVEEGGFIIRFENIQMSSSAPRTRGFTVSNEVISKGPRKPKSKYDASVDERIIRSNSPMTFTCPAFHILYNPIIMAGVNSFRGRIMSTSKDCHGQYTGLITETNKCYWNQQCQIGKRSSMPLTRTFELRCLALMPDYLSTKGYECVAKANVFDMCDKTSVITTPEGLIKSHTNYPWHYTARPIICRKKLRINPEYGLHLYTDEMDLDPSTRGDNLKVFLLRGKKELIRKYVGGRRVNLHILSGTVEVQFRVSRRSRGGRGFILRFKGIVKPQVNVKEAHGMTNEVPVVKIKRRCRSKDIRTILYEMRGKIVATGTRCIGGKRSPKRKGRLSRSPRTRHSRYNHGKRRH